MGPAHQGGRDFCGLMVKGPNRPGSSVTAAQQIAPFFPRCPPCPGVPYAS
jgi:hypothetical protein